MAKYYVDRRLPLKSLVCSLAPHTGAFACCAPCKRSVSSFDAYAHSEYQAYARDPLSQSGCRGLRPGHKGVLSRHVFYLNFSQYAKGAVRPTPPSGARGRSLLSTAVGANIEDEDEEEESMDLDEGQRAANYSAATSFYANSVLNSVGSQRRKQGQRRRRLHSVDAPSSAAQRRRQLLANSKPSPRGGGRGGGRSVSSTDPSQVAHMNVIRDPVGRCVSRFYYERDARGVFPHDYTLDECMAPNGRCAFNRWVILGRVDLSVIFVMLPFFLSTQRPLPG